MIAVAAAARAQAALIVIAVPVVAVVLIVRAHEVVRDAIAVDVGVRRRQRGHLRARDLRAGVEAAPQTGGRLRRAAALREGEGSNTQ